MSNVAPLISALLDLVKEANKAINRLSNGEEISPSLQIAWNRVLEEINRLG